MSRPHRLLVALIPLLLFLEGCSRCHRSPDEPSRTPRHTIVVGMEGPARTLDPRYISDAPGRRLEPLLHCSLFSLDPTGALIPQLAVATPIWLNPTTLAVDIRNDVVFSDGTPLAATDVKATYDFFLTADASAVSPHAEALQTLAKIEAPNHRRVLFQLKEPDAAFLSKLTVGILPEVLARTTSQLPAHKLVGCGAFTWEDGNEKAFHFSANPRFKFSDSPRTSKLFFRILKDEKKRLEQLAAGEVDLVQDGLGPNLVKDVATKYPSLLIQSRPGLVTTAIGFNRNDPTIAMPHVRLAIAHAIDRKQIINYVLGGFATPVDIPGPNGSPFQSKRSQEGSYDHAYAKNLLAEAGYGEQQGKQRLVLSFKTTTDALRIHIAKSLATQLERVGLHLNVEAMEEAQLKLDVTQGRAQMWEIMASAPTDQMDAIGLWREDRLAVQGKDLKDYTVYADGRLTGLVKAYK